MTTGEVLRHSKRGPRACLQLTLPKCRQCARLRPVRIVWDDPRLVGVLFNHKCVLREQKKRHRPPLPAVASAGRDPDILQFCGRSQARTQDIMGTSPARFHPPRAWGNHHWRPPRKTASKMCHQQRDIMVAVLTRFTPPPRTAPHPDEKFPGCVLLIAWPNP